MARLRCSLIHPVSASNQAHKAVRQAGCAHYSKEIDGVLATYSVPGQPLQRNENTGPCALPSTTVARNDYKTGQKFYVLIFLLDSPFRSGEG